MPEPPSTSTPSGLLKDVFNFREYPKHMIAIDYMLHFTFMTITPYKNYTHFSLKKLHCVFSNIFVTTSIAVYISQQCGCVQVVYVHVLTPYYHTKGDRIAEISKWSEISDFIRELHNSIRLLKHGEWYFFKAAT